MSALSFIEALLPGLSRSPHGQETLSSNPPLPLELQSRDVQRLLEESRKVLGTRCNVNFIELEQTGRLVLVGDLHGNIDNLCAIILKEGQPSKDVKYLFNGDFIDRGPYSIETLLLLLSLQEEYPSYVFLNRGNHEADLKQSFRRELRDRFCDEADVLYEKSVELFKAMQIAAVVDGGGAKAFVVHGGIPVYESQPAKLDDIMQIDRQLEPPRDKDHLVTQCLWNDPIRGHSNKDSQRNDYGQRFDCNQTRAFLETNDFKVVFRSHEMINKGLQEDHENCYTVFSALDECAQYVIVDKGLTAELKELTVELRADQWRNLCNED